MTILTIDRHDARNIALHLEALELNKTMSELRDEMVAFHEMLRNKLDDEATVKLIYSDHEMDLLAGLDIA